MRDTHDASSASLDTRVHIYAAHAQVLARAACTSRRTGSRPPRYMHAALAWQQAGGQPAAGQGRLFLSLSLSPPTLFYPGYIFITKLLYSIYLVADARALKPARVENYDSDTFARAGCRRSRNRRVFRYPAEKKRRKRTEQISTMYSGCIGSLLAPRWGATRV